MTAPDYQGVKLKLKRAQTHVDTLSREMHAMRPPDVRTSRDKLGWITAVYEGTEPPLRLGVIAGDFAHNARSALDHLVWQLVIAGSNAPGRHNVFPVYVTNNAWMRDVEKRETSRGTSPLEGVSADLTHAIKVAQPFALTSRQKDALRTALWQLHRLSLIDKHRTVHIARTCMALKLVPDAAGPQVKLLARHDQELTQGQKFLRWHPCVPQNIDENAIPTNLNVPLTIAFDLGQDSGGLVTVQRMREILGEVSSLIELLIAKADHG